MAKRRRAYSSVDEGVGDVDINAWPSVQEYFDDWRERLNKIAKATPANSVEEKQTIDAKDALVQLDVLERVNNPTMYLEAAVKIGVLFERMGLRPIEPWIGRSPRVSEAARIKGSKTALLTEAQWGPVKTFIAKRPRGQSLLDRCKQISTELQRGTFDKLPDVKIDIGFEALRKRFAKD
jgi:hypothetical protein